MKLNNAEFKIFKKLEALEKEGKISPEQAGLLAKLREKKSSNALAWWAKYPELLKDVVNVAFNYIGGTKKYGFGTTNTSYTLPGVLAIPYRQTIGLADSKTSPVNLQCYQIWLEMHRKYRGIGAYQMADLAMALIAITDVFGELADAERIYAVANTYSASNRNTPKLIAQALGFDLDGISASLANFRYGINRLNKKVKTLCLPKGLSMLENRVTLNSTMFKDSEDPRATIFFWHTTHYMLYEAQTYTTGGSITYKPHSTEVIGGTALRTVNTILADLETQIDALLLDDDIARICSDIVAAFGENGIETSDIMPEDYSISFVRNEERLLQLHNMSFGPSETEPANIFSAPIYTEVAALTTPSDHYCDIYQEDNVVKFVPAFHPQNGSIIADSSGRPFYYVNTSGQNDAYCGNPAFDCWRSDPTNEDVMCGTRFTMYVESRTLVSGGNTYYSVNPVAFGFEICFAPVMYTAGESSGMVVFRNWQNAASFSYDRELICKLEKLDWHPILYFYTAGQIPHLNTPRNMLGDLDNFTFLERETLDKLHEVAVLSGFKLDAASVDK